MLQHNAEHTGAFGTSLEVVYRWTSVVHGRRQWTQHFTPQTQQLDCSLDRRSSAWVWWSGLRWGYGIHNNEEVEIVVREYSRTPLIRTLFIRIANYPDRLGPKGKFVENSTKLTCLEITGYRIK
jgi:hypothetical protein